MKRLLIADDDAGMRAALEARFARRGWQVDVAVNGTEALARFRPGLHKLVITDVRMPGVTGLEAMAALDWPRWSVPFIVISAFGGRDLHERAFRLGAAAFLDKPFKLESLRELVRGILRTVR